jgi:hypothetical protein
MQVEQASNDKLFFFRYIITTTLTSTMGSFHVSKHGSRTGQLSDRPCQMPLWANTTHWAAHSRGTSECNAARAR